MYKAQTKEYIIAITILSLLCFYKKKNQNQMVLLGILQTIEPMKRVYSNTRDGRSFLVSRSCAPVFPCSRYFRNKGAGERTFYTGMRESIGTLNSRSCEEMTKL